MRLPEPSGASEPDEIPPIDEAPTASSRPAHLRLRRAGAVALAVAVGLIGGWLALLAFGHRTVSLGPFRVELSSVFGRGDTSVVLPPFGQLTADTHVAPIHLTATLRDIDIDRLANELRSTDVRGVVDEVLRDGRRAIPTFALWVLRVAAAGSLVASSLSFRRRWRLVATSVLSTVLVVAGVETMAWATYRPESLLHSAMSRS